MNPPPRKADLERAEARPPTPPVQPENIPEVLRHRRQWVAWQYKRRAGKWTKVPINPHTGGNADPTNPATWASFDQAFTFYRNHEGIAGIGFVFSTSDPFAGVDLDDCRDPATGTIAEWAWADIQALASYAEVSPSGTGVKVCMQGRLPPGGRKRKPYEMYDCSRFFALTGCHVPGTTLAIEDRQEQLTALHVRVFGPTSAPPKEPGPSPLGGYGPANTLPDPEVVQRTKQASNGAKFARLWAGDWTEYGSRSEADLALCGHLAFWTGPDPGRIDQLFRQSGLMRPKWDERRGQQTYGQRTVAKALQGRTEFFTRADMHTKSTHGPSANGHTGQQPLAWPKPMADEAFHGVAGEIVHLLEPHSEADPAALQSQLLVACGNAVGRTAHFYADGRQHFCNEFLLLVGRTASSRKGGSWGRVNNLMAFVDPTWAAERVQSGLASGEGLIWHIRDPITGPLKRVKKGVESYDHGIVDHGVADKRLLAIEEEFARVMTAAGRQGSTLSPLLRQAWDSAPLGGLTKGKPARVTKPHVSVIAHSTQVDLTQCLSRTDCSNGFGNRFLILCVRRSKLLPHGGDPNPPGLTARLEQLRAALSFAKNVQEMKRDEAADQVWEEHYPDLVDGPPGLAGTLLARAAPHVMRLACIHALLDRSPRIRVPHLRAALAFWDYCTQSIRYIFGDVLGDPVADAIEEALRHAPKGLTREDIRSDVFNRNKSSAVITRALDLLRSLGRAHGDKESKQKGRPPERWFYGPEPTP
jgi:hypothetical protein